MGLAKLSSLVKINVRNDAGIKVHSQIIKLETKSGPIGSNVPCRKYKRNSPAQTTKVRLHGEKKSPMS